MTKFLAVALFGLIAVIGCANAISCYNGALGAVVSTPGCTSCQKLAYTLAGTDYSVSYCLTTACSTDATSYGGNTAQSYCCSTDNCNGAETIRVALPVAILVAVSALWAVMRR